jgi:hypothetical protein
MIAWQPQQQGLLELVILLRDAAKPNSRDQALINQVSLNIDSPFLYTNTHTHTHAETIIIQ